MISLVKTPARNFLTVTFNSQHEILISAYFSMTESALINLCFLRIITAADMFILF